MNRKVLITGASRGIGRATAIEFAKQGYDLLLITAHSIDDLKVLAKEIQENYNINCEYRQCDVGNAKEVQALGSDPVMKNVYGVINNAAISYVGLLTDMNCEQWQRLMDVNLNSLFYISKVVVPQMVEHKEGKIINVSSVWGNVGASMEVAYSTAKGGVNSFTKALAKELAPSNIQVNAVAFGVIDTKMNECFSKEDMIALKEEIPADRIGTAEEAAQMILQIFNSPDYLTGQIVTMDGGWI